MVFTSRDRVLLHLLLKERGGDMLVNAADQDDISAHCGIGRTHVPRALKPLISEGLVEETQGRAPRRARRVKIYSLTARGTEAAIKLRDAANETITGWIDEKSHVHEEHCVDALRKINDRLGSMSLNRIPISLFLTRGGRRITWNEILFLSNSVRKNTIDTLLLPEGWEVTAPPTVPEGFMDREEELERMTSLINGNGVAAITGEEGIGKRTLVARWAEIHDRRPIWLKRGKGGDRIKTADCDLIVVLESSLVDVSSTLVEEGEVKLRDPRGGDWPSPLKELPLIGILHADTGLSGRMLMVLRGIDEEAFVRHAVSSGLDEVLAREYYLASKGSPLALVQLQGIDRSSIERLRSMDTEMAIMSLILGLRSKIQ